MDHKRPDQPSDQRQQGKHSRHSQPSHSGSRPGSYPCPLNILSKLSPVLGGGTQFSGSLQTRFQAGLEALHPGRFIQPEHLQVAPQNSLAKDAPRQIRIGTGFESLNMARRNLRLSAYRLDRDITLLAFPSQLVAESLHSLRSAIAALHTAACARASAWRMPDCSETIFVSRPSQKKCLTFHAKSYPEPA
jgi:hypothetical protein